MKEFTKDEKTIAMNIDKKYKWIARDDNGCLCIYEEKPKKSGNIWNTTYGKLFDECETLAAFMHMFKSIKWEDKEPTLIKNIYNPSILDDIEKRYLTAVLKPLPKVRNIYKAKDPAGIKEFLVVIFYDGETMKFPYFKPRTMYKGMEIAKTYTPEELELKL